MAVTLLLEAKHFSFSTSLIIGKVLFKAKFHLTHLVLVFPQSYTEIVDWLFS